MIYKCPNCNGALEYDPVTDKLLCSFCGNGYSIQEVEGQTFRAQESISEIKEEINIEEEYGAESETMECQIYTCTSCGAQLMVKDAEVSTFCAYCGQPTIVFSRVSKELQPDYIIPFKFGKEQAIAGIRQHLKKGFLVPKAIKNFEVEKVRGIYVPYKLYDIYYHDRQIMMATHREKNISKNYVYEAEGEYENVMLDASDTLDDETTKRLEPYDLRLLRDFEPTYMSGFYADRADTASDAHKSRVVKRVGKMFDSEAKEDVSFFAGPVTKVLESNPNYEIKKDKYALLPAWFLTFRYQNEPYTILVNGQTGKVVGTVPIDKKKIITLAILIALLSSVAFYFIWYFVFNAMRLDGADGMVVWGIVFGVMAAAVTAFYWVGIRKIKAYKKSMMRTKSQKTVSYVKDRQDEN
ncbi:MAG: hypothetical protein E7284_06160 [Lachnospiraceae bacterium]|nr:hypothetical protein [Lachnospiraceae bacterium]